MTRQPESVRRSTPVDPDKLEGIHRKLGSIRITHGKLEDADADTLRAQFGRIRKARNTVQGIVSRALPALGTLRSDLARIDAVIASESAVLALTGDLDDYRNETKRKARLRVLLSEWYEAREGVKADTHLVDELVSHAKWIREELRYAFEEASRTLASIELEYRIERSAH